MSAPNTPERQDPERASEAVPLPEHATDIDLATDDLVRSTEHERDALAKRMEHVADIQETTTASINEGAIRLIAGQADTNALRAERMQAGATPEQAEQFVRDALQAVGFATRRKLIAGTEKARLLPRDAYQNWKSVSEFQQLEQALRHVADAAVREAIASQMSDVTLFFAAENYSLPWQLAWNGEEITIKRAPKQKTKTDDSWSAAERPSGWNANREAEYRSQRSQFNPFDAEWGGAEAEGKFRAIEPGASLDVPNLAETTLVIQTPRPDGQGYDALNLNAGDRWSVQANGLDVVFRMQTAGTRKNLTILNNGSSAAKIEGHYNMPQRRLTLTLAGTATQEELDADKARAIATAEILGDRRGEPDRLAQAAARSQAREDRDAQMQEQEASEPAEIAEKEADPMLADVTPESSARSPFDADAIGRGFDAYEHVGDELLATNPLEWKKQDLEREVESHVLELEQSYGIRLVREGDGSFAVKTSLSHESWAEGSAVWPTQGTLSVSASWLRMVQEQFHRLSVANNPGYVKMDVPDRLEKAIAHVDDRHDKYEYVPKSRAKDTIDTHSRGFRTADHVLRDLPYAVTGKYDRATLNKRPKDIESLDRKGGAFAPDLVYNATDMGDPECRTWDLAAKSSGNTWDVVAHFAKLDDGSFELRLASHEEYAANPQSFPGKTFAKFAYLQAYCTNQLRSDLSFDGTRMRANTDLSAPPPELPTPEQRADVVASLPPLTEEDTNPPAIRMREIRQAVDNMRVASMGVEVPAPSYDISAYLAALTPEQMSAVFDFDALPYIPWAERQNDPAAAKEGLSYGLHPADANDEHAPMIIERLQPSTVETVLKPWQQTEPDPALVRLAATDQRYQTLVNDYAERRFLVDAYHPTTEENGIRFARSGNTIAYHFADEGAAVWHAIDDMSRTYLTIGGTLKEVDTVATDNADSPVYAHNGISFDESGNKIAKEGFMTKMERPEENPAS